MNSAHVPQSPTSAVWPWPEQRLSYGNALVVEASIAAGHVFGDQEMVVDAIELLEWLVELEWNPAGHFSFTPTSGRGLGDVAGFDQQPIEAWTLATACRRALDVTADAVWCDLIGWAACWFTGGNDAGVPVWDPRTGAAYDGLTSVGVNLNQGTESTIAFIGTLHTYRDAVASKSSLQRPRSASR